MRNAPEPAPETFSDGTNELNYAYFDGDDIGRTLELLLLEDRVDAAATYSINVDKARHALATKLTSIPSVHQILSGGDDLMISFDPVLISEEDIQLACAHYQAVCGHTVSVGIGQTPSVATMRLRRAKLLGKGRVVGYIRKAGDHDTTD